MQPMKSFGLYHPKTVPVVRHAADYSSEERARIKEAFRVTAERYRARFRKVLVSFIAFCCTVVACGFLPAHLLAWAMGAALLCWLVGAGLIFTWPEMECPGCSNDVEVRFGPHCPECGSRSLQKGDSSHFPVCSACGRTLRWGRSRKYRIHACTHCGLMLDDDGL